MAGQSGSGSSKRGGGGKPQNRGNSGGGGGARPNNQSPARSHRAPSLPPEPEPHPPVFISLPPAGTITSELADAMAADLIEVLGEFQIQVEKLDGESAVDRVMNAISKELPVLLASSDVLNPSPALIEGMFEPLEEFAVVVMPGFSGECIAASLNPYAQWDRETVAAIVTAIASGGTDIGILATNLASTPGDVFCQMPWYRGADSAGRACCRAHMKALQASEDEDFLAHRTQAALEALA